MPRHQYKGACPICGGSSIRLIQDRYGYRYECDTCQASVGCHKGTTRPLGVLADEDTKKLRIKCHELFDKKWRNRRERNALYKQMADLMGISPESCHFALMSKEQLEKAVSILNDWRTE